MSRSDIRSVAVEQALHREAPVPVTPSAMDVDNCHFPCCDLAERDKVLNEQVLERDPLPL